MYIHFYHGRKDKNEDLEEWGFDGGQYKIEAFICTYLSHIRVVLNKYKDPIDILFDEDLICVDGCYYGDFEIVQEPLKNVEIKTFKHE